ncbi:MAG: clostripain-related cysteine peptidase [Muribaculaceae bacterium]
MLLVAILFSSCADEPSSTPTTTTRTILVYMIATNSLGSYGCDNDDIAEMDKAVKGNGLNNCRLLVYRTTFDAAPVLFEILKSNGVAKHTTLKEYSKDIKSTTKERMSEVINDMLSFAKADDYGLVLWSHASGWARTLSSNSNKIYRYNANNKEYLARDFGQDGDFSAQMPIDVLASSLPDKKFSFIYADACYMGGVEVAYQLRNKTKYFVGSPSLLPAPGMPYDKNIPAFCENTPNMLKACKNTYDFYNAQSGIAKTLTISLVDCSKLEPLAGVCRDIHSSAIEITDISNIQNYIASVDAHCIYFDFGQYTSMLASAEQNTIFKSKLNDAVIYKATTGNIFGKLYIDSNKFSGLSTYILSTANKYNEDYYKTLDWYLDVYNNK